MEEDIQKALDKLTAQAKNQEKAAINIFFDSPKSPNAAIGKTLGAHIGEMVWLMGQSPTHKRLSLSDLEWLLYPPIVLAQYKVYRDDQDKPVAFVVWAYLSEEAEKRLLDEGKLRPQDWGNDAEIDESKGLARREGGSLWLIDTVAPFSDEQNRHRELAILDLLTVVHKGEKINTMQFNGKETKKIVLAV